jgi:hypothetical protein
MAKTEEELICGPVDWAALEREPGGPLALVARMNPDLAQRIADLGLTAEYEPGPDLLFLRIGPSVPALTMDVDQSIGVRVAPTTWKIVGVDVIGVCRSPGDPALRPIVVALMALALPPSAAARGDSPTRAERLAAQIRALLPAA